LAYGSITSILVRAADPLANEGHAGEEEEGGAGFGDCGSDVVDAAGAAEVDVDLVELGAVLDVEVVGGVVPVFSGGEECGELYRFDFESIEPEFNAAGLGAGDDVFDIDQIHFEAHKGTKRVVIELDPACGSAGFIVGTIVNTVPGSVACQAASPAERRRILESASTTSATVTISTPRFAR
jgi:hypothetical protein